MRLDFCECSFIVVSAGVLSSFVGTLAGIIVLSRESRVETWCRFLERACSMCITLHVLEEVSEMWACGLTMLAHRLRQCSNPAMKFISTRRSLWVHRIQEIHNDEPHSDTANMVVVMRPWGATWVLLVPSWLHELASWYLQGS